MIPLPPAIATSLKSSLTLPFPDHLQFIIVKDGVANVTNGKFYLRIDVASLGYADGYYHLDEGEGLDHRGKCWYYLKPTKPSSVYNGVINTGIDPDILRPDFNNLPPLCVVNSPGQVFMEMLHNVVLPAKDEDKKIAIDKNGIGIKTDGDVFIGFKFNVPEVMYFDARHIMTCFTDVMRHETIYIYQEKGPIYEEGPLTPLIIGSGWRNCCIVFPIPDRYRGSYN